MISECGLGWLVSLKYGFNGHRTSFCSCGRERYPWNTGVLLFQSEMVHFRLKVRNIRVNKVCSLVIFKTVKPQQQFPHVDTSEVNSEAGEVSQYSLVWSQYESVLYRVVKLTTCFNSSSVVGQFPVSDTYFPLIIFVFQRSGARKLPFVLINPMMLHET